MKVLFQGPASPERAVSPVRKRNAFAQTLAEDVFEPRFGKSADSASDKGHAGLLPSLVLGMAAMLPFPAAQAQESVDGWLADAEQRARQFEDAFGDLVTDAEDRLGELNPGDLSFGDFQFDEAGLEALLGQHLNGNTLRFDLPPEVDLLKPTADLILHGGHPPRELVDYVGDTGIDGISYTDGEFFPARLNGKELRDFGVSDVGFLGKPIDEVDFELQVNGDGVDLDSLTIDGTAFSSLRDDPERLSQALMTGNLEINGVPVEDVPDAVTLNGVPIDEIPDNITLNGVALKDSAITGHGILRAHLPPMGNIGIAKGQPGEINWSWHAGAGTNFVRFNSKDDYGIDPSVNNFILGGVLEVPWSDAADNRVTSSFSMEYQSTDRVGPKGDMTLQLHPFNVDIVSPLDGNGDVRDHRLNLSLFAPGYIFGRTGVEGRVDYRLDADGFSHDTSVTPFTENVPFADVAAITWTNDRTGEKRDNGRFHFLTKVAASTDLDGPNAGNISPNATVQGCKGHWCLELATTYEYGYPLPRAALTYSSNGWPFGKKKRSYRRPPELDRPDLTDRERIRLAIRPLFERN